MQIHDTAEAFSTKSLTALHASMFLFGCVVASQAIVNYGGYVYFLTRKH